MSLSILASGTLAVDPVRRESAGGKYFCTARMRVPAENGEATFVSLVAFELVANALLAHAKGDSVAIAGRGELKAWTDKEGTERHGLSVVVDQVLSVYQVRQRRERVTGATT